MREILFRGKTGVCTLKNEDAQDYHKLALAAFRDQADMETVRHGRWIDKGLDGDFSWKIDGRGNCWRVLECSECRCKTSIKTNYCPSCGAKMDKPISEPPEETKL